MSACYLCASDTEAGIFVHDATRTRAPWVTIACRTCGLIQHRDHPSAADLDTYYRSGAYRREFPPVDFDGAPYGSDAYPAHRRLWGDAVALFAEKNIGPLVGRTVYEVGAGDGAAALGMIRLGARVWAIEPDAACASPDVPTLPALPDPMPAGAVVVAFQVLEHQADPVAALHDWLRADTVYVEVPNARKPYVSLTHFLQWPHVVTFSPRTLGMVALAAGALEVNMNEPDTILTAVIRGRGQRRPWSEVARLCPPLGGEWSAAELRGAFGV